MRSADASLTANLLLRCLPLLVPAACHSAPGIAGEAHSPGPTADAPVRAQALAGTPKPSPGVTDGATRPVGHAEAVREITLDPKEPLHPLPELKVENIGLHIGGGPNDAETKAPFLSAIAERFPSFMDCYRHNEDPARGGSFGIDLHVGRAGGRARLEQPRTTLRGTAFRACVGGVFESVDFQRPKRGPTTLSYSLRFSLIDAP